MAEPVALEFWAMGSPCRVVVDRGADETAAAVRDLVGLLERKWSRFLDTSEVSAINRAPGCVTVVSDATYMLVSCAVRAQEATGGLFNPLMLRQLEAHGYRKPWQELTPTADRWQELTPTGPAQPVGPATEEPIVLYPEISAVRLPEGVAFDPGGIGKGLAVDMAIELCQAKGSATGCVELGGDLKVYGTPWYGSRWTIAVADPFDPAADIASFTPSEGAVTTSTTRKRCWTDGDRQLHHLLDPRTGFPSTTDIVSVTTCSEDAWWAEVAAKSALLAGSQQAVQLLETLNAPGAIVTDRGEVISTHGRRAAGVGR